jgi:hypothetical protein
MMTPHYLFALALATFFGALFHLVRGGGAMRLLLYLACSWAGFAVGQVVAPLIGLNLPVVGPFHVVEAASFALLFMVGATVLMLKEPAQK